MDGPQPGPFSPENSQLPQDGPGSLQQPQFNGGQSPLINTGRSPQKPPLQPTPPIIPGAPPPREPETLGRSRQQVQRAQRDGPGLYTNKEYIRELEAKAEMLEILLRQQEPSSLKILYRLEDNKKLTTYFDWPEWQAGESGYGNLRSTLPVSNLPLYLQQHQDIAFIVFRDFSRREVNAKIRENRSNFDIDSDMPSVKHTSEAICSVSNDLSKAIMGILGSRAEFTSLLEDFKRTSQVPAPYLFIYHSRSFIDDLTVNMSDQTKRQLAILLKYVNTEFNTEYEAADSLLSRGCISVPYMKYLFKPNDILVEGKDDRIRAYVSSSWPEVPHRRESSDTNDKGQSWIWDIETLSWEFDGDFRRKQTRIRLCMAADDNLEEDIVKLNVRPLKHEDDVIVRRLQRRGQTFWDCRFRHLVSYNEDARHEMQNSVGARDLQS